MKKCPNCQKTFDDDKRFCQVDGTPLVDDIEPAQAEDPFKTVVIGSQNPVSTPEDPMKTTVISADSKDEDILQIPEVFDPMKTMVVKEPLKFDEPVATPSFNEPAVPEPPKFNEPNLKPPTFGDLSSNEPPKPIDPPKVEPPIANPFNEPSKVEPPIVNPFNEPPKIESPFSSPISDPPKPIETPQFKVEPKASEQVVNDSPFSKPPSDPFSSPLEPKTPPPPVFKEPETPFNAPPSPFGSPFNQPNDPVSTPIQKNDWNPPAQNQSFGAEPLQPSAVAPAGQNNTLAIVSLVAGILGFVCLPLLGPIVAIITGQMQKGKIKSNPAEYGGEGLAKIGVILGIVNIVLSLLAIIAYVVMVFFVLAAASR